MDKDTRKKADKLIKLALSKKAEDPLFLDTSNVNIIWDAFIIVSADSQRQLEAICRFLVKESSKQDIAIHHKEIDELSWGFIDFYDVAFNIFLKSSRDFYNLENLWRDAKVIKINK